MKIIINLLLIILIFCSVSYAEIDLSLEKEIEHSIKIGLTWLVEQQEDDGSWQHYPALTGLSIIAILRSNPGINYKFSPIKKGLEFISICAKPNGSIYIEDMPSYNTSICLMALKEAQDPKYDSLMIKAEEYLINLQIDEGEGYTKDSLYYGGVGYGGDERPDLSNLQWALEAMLERKVITSDDAKLNKRNITNLKRKKLFFDKALVFLKRCQNLKEYNPESYSKDDGGFMYEPGKSKAGGVRSYGNMTYAGLKSINVYLISDSLYLAKSDNTGGNPATPGTTIRYTITYGNPLTTSLTNVHIFDELLSDTLITYHDCSNEGNYNSVSNVVSWHIDEIPAGETDQTVWVDVKVKEEMDDTITVYNYCSLTSELPVVTAYTTTELSPTPETDEAYFSPNPYNPETDGLGKFYPLFENSTSPITIKIYDTAGEMVKEIISVDLDDAKWNGKNEFGDYVANSPYFGVVKNEAGEKVVIKIAILR